MLTRGDRHCAENRRGAHDVSALFNLVSIYDSLTAVSLERGRVDRKVEDLSGATAALCQCAWSSDFCGVPFTVSPIATIFSTHNPACDSCRVKKIRCGRERPLCLNCKRNRLQCTFSDRGKRPNQNQKVIENLGGLHERLESIDNSLVKLMDMMQHNLPPNSSPALGSLNPAAMDYFGASKINDAEVLSSQDVETEARFCGDSQLETSHHVLSSGANKELYYGPLSLFSIQCKAEKSLLELQKSDSIADDQLQHCLDIFAKLKANLVEKSCFGRPTKQSNDAYMQIPPKGLLKASLALYFSRYHWRAPIFDENKLRERVDLIYDNPSDPSRNAMAVICNCIVVRSLTIRIEDSLLTSGDSGHSNGLGMDVEFVKEFLEHARSGLDNSDLVFQPRLLNVQALILLMTVGCLFRRKSQMTLFQHAFHSEFDYP
ncbi:hypothetical protein NA57DRAFT_56355 [Rhizodiscina lignyota]|uniref:Zn(2)-C6 fungal-type domain-containing protein n=1 Tax=Rhizodiscina lignyota TaxID=1504668 RepID=A0A9P4MAF5_9PEZI|nr:hypothetical protein NA57DRAFT_56355 [Rhizodiscina lignyota]